MSRRDDVLSAALELLDEVGLDGITIRKLAERLGVQPGALYRHFDSKRALLDAMVEHIAAAGAATELPTDVPWPDLVRGIAISARAGMLSHRDGALLMATFFAPGPEAVASWERFIGVLRAAGATPTHAMSAIDTIFSYVNGFTIEEQARAGDHKDAAFLAGLNLIITGIQAGLQPD
jgi:TetR/AcrR family tetracycline transcriptional repressor